MNEYLKNAESETFELIRKLSKIPSPSGMELKKAEFIRDYLIKNSAEDVVIDDVYNVLYPYNCEGKDEIILFMAHTDTVFPDTDEMPFWEDDEKMYSPGVGDDTACVAVLLSVAKYIAQNKPKSDKGILIALNSCEEGLGNLKGIRKIMENYGKRIKEAYTFDGQYTHIVNKCVGSYRYEITFKTEGGHSFNAFGNRNAIRAMADFINRLYECEIPKEDGSKTTYNVGTVEGGTSVNTIAQSAKMLYEYRSDSVECLKKMESFFYETVENFKKTNLADIEVKTLGIRPCADGVDEKKLKEISEKVIEISKKHSGVECIANSGSTDCNIPMSMGIPAVCVGSYIGKGMHTREEYIIKDSIPTGLKIAFELILGYFKKSEDK